MDPAMAGLVKIGTDASAEASRTANQLWARVLGPSADEIGEWMGRIFHRRLNSAEAIARAAERKGATEKPGEVNPRLAYKVLEEGSWFDGDLAAEYFGGMLAGSKTPDGRADAAISWAAMVSSMSSAQIRLHFILYREWASLLSGRGDLNLGVDADRQEAAIHADYMDTVATLAGGPVNRESMVSLQNATNGLARLGLISNYAFGSKLDHQGELASSPYELAYVVWSSPAGCELYAWAQGAGEVAAGDFLDVAVVFDPETPVPRLGTAVAPRLDPDP